MADTGERTRAWDEARKKDTAEIASIDADTREKAKAEDKARVRLKANDVQRSVVEAVANITAIEDAGRGKRERAQAEARSKADAKIK